MTIIIEKATIKMKKLLKYILLLIYVALMPACGEDSGLDGVFANKPFALVTAEMEVRPPSAAVTREKGLFANTPSSPESSPQAGINAT